MGARISPKRIVGNAKWDGLRTPLWPQPVWGSSLSNRMLQSTCTGGQKCKCCVREQALALSTLSLSAFSCCTSFLFVLCLTDPVLSRLSSNVSQKRGLFFISATLSGICSVCNQVTCTAGGQEGTRHSD